MSTTRPEEGGSVPAARSVGTVARLLGTATSTLRTWDRRYGLGPSGRSDGSHRRYTPEDVARLTLMRRLLDEGAVPAEAARVAARTLVDRLPVAALLALPLPAPMRRRPVGPRVVPDAAGAPSLLPVDVSTEQAVEALAAEFVLTALEHTTLATLPAASGDPRGKPDRLRRDAGEPDAAPGPPGAAGPAPAARAEVPAQLRRMARALVLLDTPAMTEMVLDATARRGVVASWDSLITPVLRGIDRQFDEVGSAIAIEHVFSETVLAVLRHRTVELEGVAENARPAVLASGPAENNSLPLYALAAALAERHVGARVLGPRVPTAALLAAVRRSRSYVVFVWSQQPATAVLDLAGLRAEQPGVRVVVAGAGWDPPTLDPEVIYVEEFGRAVDTVAALAG